MTTRITSVLSVAVLSIFAATSANAAVSAGTVTNPVTGHVYEIFVYESNDVKSWPLAKAAAEGKTYTDMQGNEIQGHLATITSEAEDLFVEFDVRQAVPPETPLPAPEVWVGGSQAAGSAVGAGWVWENSEGTISTPQVPLLSYSNWLSGEPNDANSGESHLGIGLGGQYGWNDESALGNIGGYMVEYDAPIVIGDCSQTAEGCTTIQGHTLAFPPGSFEEGDEISFTAFEFTSLPSQCGAMTPTVIFDDNPALDNLIIPGYLCGSPKFVVIAVDSSELDILDGTVLVENDTATVLPDNLYECTDPILPVTNFADGDPQHQDVVVWQTTDPTQMLENDLGASGTEFEGAAGEFTDSCGSSRARVKGASYYVVGLHIDFGLDYTTVPDMVNTKFVDLTRYKMELLAAAVEESKPYVKNGDYKKMQQMVKNAIAAVDIGDFVDAKTKIDNFLKFVDKTNYTTAIGIENYNGEHIMRASNIEFMLRVKVIPYAP
jgi:hypothetical protein